MQFAFHVGVGLDQVAPIRRLNPKGDDILKRYDWYPPVGDVRFSTTESTIQGPSIIVDLAVDESGIYYALDSRRGRVFAYDPDGILHLLFNMLFLWVFGRAVEDRLGHVGFLAFYLVGGIIAGWAHSLVDRHPVIGASGSIAGVTGAFLALFPRSRVQVLFFISLISVPSLLFILLYVAIDLLNTMAGGVAGPGAPCASASICP